MTTNRRIHRSAGRALALCALGCAALAPRAGAQTSIHQNHQDLKLSAAQRGAVIDTVLSLLDRSYVEQTVKREARQDDDQDPIADVIISGLRAAATLKAGALREPIQNLSRQDRSLKVRQAALEALKMMEHL